MRHMYAEIRVRLKKDKLYFVECTTEFTEMTGYTREEVKTKFDDNLLAFFESDDAFLLLQHMKKAESECCVLEEPYSLKTSRGIVKKILIQLENLNTEYGDIGLCLIDDSEGSVMKSQSLEALIDEKSMSDNGTATKDPVSREWLLEESNDIVYVSDFYNYDLLYMNKGARRLFNMKEGNDYINQKCYKVLQGYDAPCSFCTNKLLNRESFYTWEYRNNVISHSFLLKDRIVDWYGHQARIEFATDITNVDRRNKILEQQLQVDQTIIECLKSVNTGRPLKETAMYLLEEVGKLYQADRAFMILRSDEDNRFILKYLWRNENVQMPMHTDWEWDYFLNAINAYPKNYNSYWMNDMTLLMGTDITLYSIYEKNNVKSQRVMPFFVNQSLEGYVGFDNPLQLTEEMTVLETLCHCIAEEITRSRLSQRLTYLCYHDALTGLQNRNHFSEYMNQLKQKPVLALGVAVADLNALSEINRYRGHSGGDLVVKNLAELLKKHFDEKKLYRLSGDEFLAFYENCTEKQLLKSIQKVYDGSPQLEAFGISIGYAWSAQCTDASKLITQANEMMLMRKQTYYQKAKPERLKGKHRHDRLQLLMDALEKGYFCVYLQPKTNCQTEEITGAEALARFDSPESGLKPPSEFISELEQNYTIKYLDLFIFEEVCRLFQKWRNEGRRLLPVSLNFSRLTLLEPDILETISRIAGEYDVDKGLIELEITETLGMFEDNTIAEIGRGIKKAGFRLSLDDFGSFYTNMSILSKVPADVLKIDKSLIDDLEYNRSNSFLLKHLFSFCEEIGIQSVAEGVENRGQLKILKDIHCDEIQGYLFGRPMKVEMFEENFL